MCCFFNLCYYLVGYKSITLYYDIFICQNRNKTIFLIFFLKKIDGIFGDPNRSSPFIIELIWFGLEKKILKLKSN